MNFILEKSFTYCNTNVHSYFENENKYISTYTSYLTLLNEQLLYILLYIESSSRKRLKIGVLIKSRELLVVYKFQSD